MKDAYDFVYYIQRKLLKLSENKCELEVHNVEDLHSSEVKSLFREIIRDPEDMGIDIIRNELLKEYEKTHPVDNCGIYNLIALLYLSTYKIGW